MGLLNFWKKKASDQLASQSPDAQSLTDLPPLEGIEGNSFDGSNVQSYDNMQSLPSFDNPAQTNGSKSISFNVPTLDFSLPASDDSQLAPQGMTPFGTPINNVASNAAPNDALNVPDLNSDLSIPSLQTEETKPSIDEEDLNHLFVNDDNWKEPDWNNFEPYTEEKIDEPKPEDFKGAELPRFDEDTSSKSSMAMVSDEPMSAPVEPFSNSQRPVQKPVELFIRGKAYNRVFTELDQMSKTLVTIDGQMDTYEEMLKREEPLLIVAKDQMEYLYRKLNQIDKKIFAQ